MDDTGALFERFRRGDPEALERLYYLYAGPLLGFLRHVLPDPAAAEDVLQTVWCRAIEHAGSLRDPSKARPWFFRVAHREALRRVRELRRLEPTHADPGTESDADPSSLCVRAESAREVRETLLRLPAAQREVLWLAVVEGLSHAEIADILQIPLGTSRSRLHHALRNLQTLIGEPHDDPAAS